MSRVISPATGRAYGLARRARVWQFSRATVYRHRVAPDLAAPAGPIRRGPVGAGSDAALVEHIRVQILGSRLHGEGYRKIWARLRHGGIRTSARRVRHLMGRHSLLAPHRVGCPKARVHDGTITTTAVDAVRDTVPNGHRHDRDRDHQRRSGPGIRRRRPRLRRVRRQPCRAEQRRLAQGQPDNLPLAA